MQKIHFITNLKDQLKISYSSFNKKKHSKTVLFFCHGTGFSSHLFFPSINQIYQRKFDGCSIAIDFRGKKKKIKKN
jgi:predicted esterase